MYFKKTRSELRTMKGGMPKWLPIITLENGKKYFIDRRLKQLRNIFNPHVNIDFIAESEPERFTRSVPL